MSGSGIRVEMPGGIDAYLAAGDETAAELLASDDLMVATLRDYGTYFRESIFREFQPSALPLVLCMNAYQFFLASIRMALCGQTAAVFPLLRTALENAAYARLMIEQPDLQETWTIGTAARRKRRLAERLSHSTRRSHPSRGFQRAFDPGKVGVVIMRPWRHRVG